MYCPGSEVATCEPCKMKSHTLENYCSYWTSKTTYSTVHTVRKRYGCVCFGVAQ